MPEGDPWLQLNDDSGDDQPVTTPFRRRKGGVTRRFGRGPVIALVVLVCLALLGGGGYYLFLGGQAAGPEGQRYFADLSVSRVMGAVAKEGFECIPGRTIAQCEKSISGADLSVTVHFVSETEITMLEASGGTAAYSGEEEANAEELSAFFGMAARLPLPEESTSGDAVGSWAAEHVNKGGEHSADGVRYTAAADQPLLTMRPA